MEWRDGEGQTTGCPLVVHLPGGAEIDSSTFESPKAMAAIADTTSFEDFGNFYVTLKTADYCVETIHKDGTLLVASAQVWPRSRETLKVTINGRTIVLPISEEELIEALGRPHELGRPLQR